MADKSLFAKGYSESLSDLRIAGPEFIEAPDSCKCEWCDGYRKARSEKKLPTNRYEVSLWLNGKHVTESPSTTNQGNWPSKPIVER